MSKYRLFRFAFWMGPRVPRPLALALAVIAGNLLWCCAPAMRGRVRTSLAHIPTLAANPQRLSRVVRQAFVHLVLNYVDLFAPVRLTPETVLAYFDVPNPHMIQEIIDRGKGLILVTHHHSAFEWAKHGFRQFATGPIIVPSEELQPAKLYDLVRHERGTCGFDFLPVSQSETLRDMLATLRKGGTILLAMDRDIMQSGVTMPLFNGCAHIPTGAIALARRTGAPILWVSAERETLNHCRAEIMLLDVPISTATRDDAAMRTALTPIVAQMERMILRHPEQWLAAFADDVWVEDESFMAIHSSHM